MLRYDAHQKHELHNKKSIFLDILATGDCFPLVTTAAVAYRIVASDEAYIDSTIDIKD